MDKPVVAAYRAVIHGRVQGVGFRYTAVSKALSLGLTGWVRNLGDGTVETHFEGESAKAKEFLRWLGHGPPGARVLRVDKQSLAPQQTFATFTVEY